MRIQEYLNNPARLDVEYQSNIAQGFIRKEIFAEHLTNAHLDKAKHNLKFVQKNMAESEFNDWSIIGLYFTIYHIALAILASKGYTSKNHSATLLFLLHECLISHDEAVLIDELNIDKEDAEFYSTLREHRRNANYSTNIMFTDSTVLQLRVMSVEFLNKIEAMLA